ncbi:MAG: anti-sigma factor [Candidatus Dormibacteraeota bacterium]|nr:anti-sigma factor [Candidatus Dormibacteraeota bacterium]
MISHPEAEVLAAALSVGSLDADEQSALQLHLSGCADCRRVAGEYMEAAARLPLALEPLQPSPELRGRLMRAVYAEATQAAEQAARAQPAPWWRRLWQAIPASRGLTVVTAAAAVAVIALSSWAALNRQNGASAPVAVALTAAPSAPHASAHLTYQRGGDEAVLTASGLPSPGAVSSGGSVYEVWLIHSDGSAVAAAYLSHNPDGTWSAAVHGDLTAYSAVAATAEPAGGSSSPTGTRVIQGAIRS